MAGPRLSTQFRLRTAAHCEHPSPLGAGRCHSYPLLRRRRITRPAVRAIPLSSGAREYLETPSAAVCPSLAALQAVLLRHKSAASSAILRPAQRRSHRTSAPIVFWRGAAEVRGLLLVDPNKSLRSQSAREKNNGDTRV